MGRRGRNKGVMGRRVLIAMERGDLTVLLRLTTHTGAIIHIEYVPMHVCVCVSEELKVNSPRAKKNI